MPKAKDAFRTISEVAEWLDTPTHVLRFWESKFSQIKPVKGAGGRRYYRPTDMDLLGGIKQLLHEDGLTIKGAQKLLREKGVKHVAALGPSMNAPVETARQPGPDQAKPAPVERRPTVVRTPPVAVVLPTNDDITEQIEQEVQNEAPVQEALPFDAPITRPKQPEPAPKRPFRLAQPPLPDGLPMLPARSFGVITASTEKLCARQADIMPILQRLAELQADLERSRL